MPHHFRQAEPLTMEHLKAVLHYDPETGVFTRLNSTGGVAAGTVAGWKSKDGHRCLSIDRIKYKAHRVAWFYMTGKWPKEEVDHRDTDGMNNRWLNLREATSGQNKANRGKLKTNTSGLKGVSVHPDGKWQAKIRYDNKQFHLGLFDCKAAGHFAYVVAADKAHGNFARA